MTNEMRIFYYFRASPGHRATVFDMDCVTVFDLKRRVMMECSLGKGTDYDFCAYNDSDEAQGVELNDKTELHDGQHIRVRRTPAHRPGQGQA